MFSGLTSNALEQIKIVEELIAVNEKNMEGQDAQKRRRMKVYAVSSCVTRLYAIYEGFVESIVSDFLDSIPELIPYEKLAEELRADYRIGISHILSRIDSERYDHLVHENVVRWYHEAVTNAPSYRFVTEALTRHEQNLRLNVVDNLFSRIQLKDFNSWLTHNEEIMSLYAEQAAIYEQLEAEMKIFIQLRNDAAHGVLEDIEGKQNLARFCDLIKALIRAISSYFHKCMILYRWQAGKILKIGEVTEVFLKPGAFIAQVDNATEIRKGMNLHIVGPYYCYKQPIQSLQVNDAEVEQVTADRDKFEIGLKCPMIPKRNALVYVDM